MCSSPGERQLTKVWHGEQYSPKQAEYVTQQQIAKAERAMPYGKFIERFTAGLVRDVIAP